jgi:putative PEP-CTERM system integral membrane protein
LRAWWKSLRQQSGRKGWLQPVLVTSLVIAASIGLGVLAVRQPQAKAFALLETPPASTQEAQTLVDQSASIRSGLVNAYLAPFRYISAEGEVVHIRDIYSSTFDIPAWRAYDVQRMYEGLASPLLYQPVNRPEPAANAVGQRQIPEDNHALTTEPQEAARLYQNFFDTPIVEAERPTIVRAARSTWSPAQAEAAWQAVDDREVHLVSQELNLQEHGDWADVELHEAYQNQTAEFQEVVYYFNLPESAVLTGVWLGNSPNKEDAFSFQVAPRGAAQQVYREETRKNIDPALLEQIGPR